MSIQVILDNREVLYPGTLLQGTVVCSLESNTSVRAIKLRFYGKEKTSWSQKRGKNTVYYRGKHFFFQMETKLFEPEDHQMQRGTYKYPFQFILPPNIPSPFEFPYGYIRYSLKGIIDIPLAVDPRHRLDLELISVLDISTLPMELKQPFQTNNNSNMGCCLFDSGSVKVEAQVNKRAFLPGETINVDAEIHNSSGSIINEVSLKLIRCFVAHSITPRHETKFINEDLLVEQSGGLEAHSSQIYNFNLQIPLNIAIPNMSGCQILEGLYRLAVYCTTSGMNRNLEITLCEVQVGHLNGNNTLNGGATSLQMNGGSSYPHPSGTTSFPSAPAVDMGNSSPPPQYDDVVNKM